MSEPVHKQQAQQEQSTISAAFRSDVPKENRGRWKPLVLLGALVVILVLARQFGLGNRLGELRGWIDSLGAWGPLAFTLLYVAGVVAALPGSALTVAAGALFGSIMGSILVSVAATVGASLSFLIGRYFARDATARWLGKSEKFPSKKWFPETWSLFERGTSSPATAGFWSPRTSL